MVAEFYLKQTNKQNTEHKEKLHYTTLKSITQKSKLHEEKRPQVVRRYLQFNMINKDYQVEHIRNALSMKR